MEAERKHFLCCIHIYFDLIFRNLRNSFIDLFYDTLAIQN